MIVVTEYSSYVGQLSISAVEHVIESLTPNARRIFRLLVEAFLANSNSKDYEGLLSPSLNLDFTSSSSSSLQG